jgi:Plasmid pRiA4b ORF-3-like protein
LATAIDGAFARWDVSHVHEFQLQDDTRIGRPDPDFDDEVIDERRERLSRLEPAQQFVYVFDFGDYWAHLCTVAKKLVDPRDVVGLVPDKPMPYFGWGSIPDQYGRGWENDDGTAALPQDPGLTDLPPLQPGWGLHQHED